MGSRREGGGCRRRRGCCCYGRGAGWLGLVFWRDVAVLDHRCFVAVALVDFVGMRLCVAGRNIGGMRLEGFCRLGSL